MSIAGSVISATDLELFKNLSNPTKVDVRQNPRNNLHTKPDIPPTTINGGQIVPSSSSSPRDQRSKHSSRSRSRTHSRSRSRSRSRSQPVSPPHSTPRNHNHDDSRSRHSHSRSHSRTPSNNGHSRRPDATPMDRFEQSMVHSHSRSRNHSSRSHSRSRSRSNSHHHSPQPIRTSPQSPQKLRSILRDHNPFRTSGSVIPAFYNKSVSQSPQRPMSDHRRPSIFDQETQKYLRPSSPAKLPFHSRGPSMRLYGGGSDGVQPPSRFFSPPPVVNTAPSSSPRESHSRSRSHRRHRSHRHGHSRSRSRGEDESTQQEKRRYLLELEKLKLQGIKLTREYSMNDSLADIRFEHDSHRSNYDVVDSVNFMKDILGASFVVIETLNQKVGPILQLRGWSAYMKQNMSRFDRVLERAYHRFWRHGQPSPVMEFGWLIFGSMLMYHIQNKYLAGLPVGDMFNIMGPSQPSNATGRPIPGGSQAPNAQNAPTATGTGNGGFSLGSILNLFTGGNANRPQPQGVSTQPTRPVNIIPPLPSAQPQSQPQPQIHSQPPRQTVAQNSIPITARPVPPTGTAATLPPMNVRGITPPVRSIRRPSAHLREPDYSRAPLSPVTESHQENDVPTPPP